MIKIFTDYPEIGKAIVENGAEVREKLIALIKGHTEKQKVGNLIFCMEKSVGTFEVYQHDKQVATIWISAN